MKIVTYRDLTSKDGLLPLMDHAFRWPFNQRTFEDFIKRDPRSRDSPVGFCALENDLPIGFVGVLHLSTRTMDGSVERVGGIYGVATLPSHVRKGVSTALMKRAHEYFAEKGFRFSFLTTSRTLIAHAFYEKLGYFDVAQYPSAYKIVTHKKAELSTKKETAKFDFDKILKIYNEFSRDKTGFVIRDKEHLKMFKKGERITAKQCMFSEKGYAIFRKDREGVWIRELIALTAKDMERLVSRIEQQARDMVYDRIVLNKALLRFYESHGYMIRRESHSVLMAKPLTANASIKQAYGDKFFMTSLDWF
ncbi:MAG: GNAT family N-acetyltransferase [Candidatus Bathyarchaeia archaeon]